MSIVTLNKKESHSSVVSTATAYGLDDWGVRVRSSMVKNYHFSISTRSALGSTQPPIQWVLGALLQGLKQQGHDVDHSPPTSTEVKETWIITSTPPYAFMV
jgi:hypothetical protein